MFAVAIDGPSGAGKSSVARAVSEQLGFIYVDTGSIYRTVALALLQKKIELHNAAAVAQVLPAIKVTVQRINGEQRMFLSDKDVTDLLRTPEVTKAASITAAMPAVREFLLLLQRQIAQENDVIMDGRDIGTVVLPHAQVKIFLTASAEERTHRRIAQMERAGMPADFDTVYAEICERDERDINRAAAPLKPAEDAVLVDSSALQREETVCRIVGIIEAKRG